MTKLVGLDKWVDTLLGRLNGAEPQMVRTEVSNTIREFFRESTVWRQDLFLKLKAGTPTYDMTGMIPGASVLYVLQAFYNERLLRPVENFPYNWQEQGTPHSYWSPEPELIRFAPIPAEDDATNLRLRVALRPTDCQVPDWTESHFFGAIADGALARIYLHPKRPYSSASLGAMHGQKFARHVASARSQASKRFTTAAHAFAYPRGWSPIV